MRTRLFISILLLATGLLGSHSLTRADQELRVIYAEYTLAATDLGHVNGELIRYRTGIIRAIEADNPRDFERIATSLPHRRARIEAAIDRFVKASNSATSGTGTKTEELKELREVRARLDAYMASSQQTVSLLERRWQEPSPAKAREIRDEAEHHATHDAASKFIAVTLELDQLVDVVARIAGEVREGADRHLRLLSFAFIGSSLALAALVLLLPSR